MRKRVHSFFLSTLPLSTRCQMRLASSEPCLHTWPFLLQLPCQTRGPAEAREVWGHAHCHPWDMEWFSDAEPSGFSRLGVTKGATVIR